MSLHRADPLIFQFLAYVLICCCSCCVAGEDLEGQTGKLVLGGFDAIPTVRGGSEEDVSFEDKEALLAFKKGVLDDPTGVLSSWNNQTFCCRWHGVKCQAVVGNLNRLISLQLPSSRLGGSISPRIAELSELRHLDLSNNSFRGFIPRELCRLKHLQTLSLSMNQLSSFLDGTFVQDHGRKLDSRPKDLVIFEGSSCACDPFAELQVLDLSNNFLTGAVSEKLGRYLNLREIKLGNNLLMGAIPANFGSLRFLSILSLENNMLDSSIPLQLSNCHSLQYFDAKNNFLSGKVPSELLQLLKLGYLNLTNNFLEELNPSRQESMDQKLRFRANANFVANSMLRYSQKLLSRLPTLFTFNFTPAAGRFRRWLIAKELQSMSPSFAPAPAPLFAYSSASSVATATAPPPTVVSTPKKNRHTARRWILGLVIGFVAGAVSGVICCFIFNRIRMYWREASAPTGPTIFHLHIQPKDLAFLESLDTFSGESVTLLGKGASGQVFKACLANGMLVAIKRIPIRVGVEETEAQPAREETSPEMGQVRAELETLGKIRHRNLVLLLAYVMNPDAHLLIYQYMKNGSLHDILNKVREGKMELKWLDRYRIALSVAVGLKYLHFDCSPRVLHRDIKPSNILLNEEMEAHLGDFGLARLIPDDKSHITTGWAGTVGYIPPEYHQTCRFTEAGDVFSFGITLAVLLTGREPTDVTYMDEHGGTIMAHLQDHRQAGTLKDILDPQMAVVEEDLDYVDLAVKVALFCTSDNASDRPSSKEVVAMLEQVHAKKKISI